MFNTSLIVLLLFALLNSGIQIFAKDRGRVSPTPATFLANVLTLAFLFCALQVDQLWLSIVSWSFASWLVLWSATRVFKPEQNEVTSLAPLYACITSDACLLIGLLALQSTGRPMIYSVLQFPDLPSSSTGLDQAFRALAACGLLSGIGIRSALFPTIIWVKRLGTSDSNVLSVAGILLPVTAGMLLRLQPLIDPIPEIRQAMIGIGALTLLLAGFLAFGQPTLRQRLLYSTVSLVGLTWLACGVGEQHADQLFRLTVACAICFSVQIIVQGNSGLNWILSGFLLVVIGLGITGQQQLYQQMSEMVFQGTSLEQGALPLARAARFSKGNMRSAAWRNGQTFSQVALEVSTMDEVPISDVEIGSVTRTPIVSPLSLYAVPLGMLVLCLNIARSIFERSTDSPHEMTASTILRGSLPFLAICAAAVVLLLDNQYRFRTVTVVTWGAASLGLFGIPLAWLAGKSPAPTRAWVQQDLYAGPLIQSFVVTPFRVGCLVIQNIDTLVIERLAFGILRQGRRVIGEACEILQAAQNSHPESRWSWVLLTVVVLMLATLV